LTQNPGLDQILYYLFSHHTSLKFVCSSFRLNLSSFQSIFEVLNFIFKVVSLFFQNFSM
jgi:hypothetical protein